MREDLALKCGHDQNYKNNNGKNILHVGADQAGEFGAFACVDLCKEVIPSPTVAVGAEEDKYKTAEGKDDI